MTRHSKVTRSARYRHETERALARMLARTRRPNGAARLAARLILRDVTRDSCAAQAADLEVA